MKKKILSLILCLALALSLAPAALAASVFADITDTETIHNVEVLRLMGVIEGDNGLFRPNSSLTRAEFCKMAVVLAGKRSAVSRYSTRTVFPDVRASHWAVGYVNCAASREMGLIHGMPDGTFQPNRAITYGEATAILTRMLGYTDADSGGIWPDGYIALAGKAGMTRGLSIKGNSAITRAQAARLFVNALTAMNSENVPLLSLLGYNVDLAAEPIALWSVDTVNGRLRLSDGTTPELARPLDGTALIGLKGRVVTNPENKVVTFLPVTGTSGSAISDAAIIVSADGSTAGFDALTGGATNYTIFRNGIRATAAQLKKNDVVTYNPTNNTVHACDTRVTVSYENCDPSPSAPTTIIALGGTAFRVLPTARQNLAAFKPGEIITLLLTADGRVAGATEGSADGNAFAFVNGGGEVFLLCGGNTVRLGCGGSGHEGEVVRISQNKIGTKTTLYLTKQSGGANGALDLSTKTLGTHKLADGVLVFEGGALSNLSALGVSRVEQRSIAYARTNDADEIDLIVIKDSSNAYYGRAKTGKGEKDNGPFGVLTISTLKVNYGADLWTAELECAYEVCNDEYVEAVLNDAGEKYLRVTPLAKIPSVASSAWIGDTAVNYGGQTYLVYPDSVACWNRDAGVWFAGLAAAKAYGGTMDLFVKDGVVRVIEVRS